MDSELVALRSKAEKCIQRPLVDRDVNTMQ